MRRYNIEVFGLVDAIVLSGLSSAGWRKSFLLYNVFNESGGDGWMDMSVGRFETSRKIGLRRTL